MARLRIDFGDAAHGRDALDWRLSPQQLAAPVVAAGRDWLRLQGDDDADSAIAVAAFVATDTHEAPADLLVVELRGPAGEVRWRGSVPREELGRIAARAVLARAAAGLRVHRARDDRPLRYRMVLDRDDPRAPDLEPIEVPDGVANGDPGASAGDGEPSFGIDWDEPVAGAPQVETTASDRWRVARIVVDHTPADLVVALRPAAWDAIVDLAAESIAARQERALLLLGERRRARVDGPAVPFVAWFDVAAVRRPEHVHATATELVLGPTQLGAAPRGEQGVVGLLHTHLPGCGLEPSDQDLRDLDDIDHGGPGAISVICTARRRDHDGPLELVVLCRDGRRRGHVLVVAPRVVVATPIAAPSPAVARASASTPAPHPVREEPR